MGSFRGRDHFGVDLGIITGLGIISGSGSFRGLYRTQSNIIELTIKFCQSNTIERSITERLVIEPNRTFDYRTIGIIERSINERRIA